MEPEGVCCILQSGQAVTIGQLSSNVAERFQIKNGSNHSSVLLTGQIGAEEAKKETELLQEQSCAEAISWLSQMLLLLFSLQTVKQTSAAVRLPTLLYVYILKREVSDYAEDFPLFYFHKRQPI